MKPYDKTLEKTTFGYFDTDIKAGYTIDNPDKLSTPWYFVYNNKKVLLYVDQNGPVKAQYQPPNGILAIKREMGETQSKWQVWVSSPDLNGGVPVSNFGTPELKCDGEKPVKTVTWCPEKAIYTQDYTNVKIITEILVPSDKATVCMKTTIENKTLKAMEFTATPALFPYCNIPQMVAWDLPEWYLSTSVYKRDNMLTFHAQMKDPSMKLENYRSVTFNIDYDENAQIELDWAKFKRNGNFLAPGALINNLPFSINMNKADGAFFDWYQAVYAARYNFSLNAGESKTFTQVLTFQECYTYSEEENIFDKAYFDDKEYVKRVEITKAFYDDIFSKRTIRTENKLYDNFINYFTPLQMLWVSSLDRGWPSSMRGIRDCSQDFTGMLPIDPTWTRQVILEMFLHQRTDGWMPRQISTISREAPHDMRNYCDGGAFLLELINEYLTFTRDADLLNEKVMWLDSDEESTILEHIERCIGYYLDEKNIGEHGICKVWYGDWWDSMNDIGSDGIGETVTVTAQTICNLKNLSDMLKWLVKDKKLDESYLEKAEDYLEKRDFFVKNMKEHAYNSAGFFNGFYNDNRKWLLSECDPDGEKRVYLVSNSWALISGCATNEMAKGVIDIINKESFGRVGYNTKSVGNPTFIPKGGKECNGTFPVAGSYNHAQSFFARACCICGDSETAYKATRYILPIEEEYAPVEKTFAPPFAIANEYSNRDSFVHRVLFQYLSGTVSYVLRIVYNFFFGITYGYNGLTIKPCLPKEFGDCSVDFTYLGKKITLNFKKTDDEVKTVVFNGIKWNTEINELSNKPMAFFEDNELLEENIIDFEY